MRINLKSLRQEIEEDIIPGKFVRGKSLPVGYLILVQLSDNEYAVVTHEEGEGYHTQSWTPRNLDRNSALKIYESYNYDESRGLI